ncbi:hypothetical protein LXA43DRAFT_889272 [Ganoderma leucocontextum]|nr:hypothetical protein LXA43DRAFT_889272 [Ganoderma leucocontextum]
MITTLARVAAPPGPNVLCNVMKGEYVREDTLATLGRGSGPVAMTLVAALISRICYSIDNSIEFMCGEAYAGKLAKGPWAGDRFCIRSAQDMAVERPWTGCIWTEWNDVTEEVNGLLCQLWNFMMGYDSSDDED